MFDETAKRVAKVLFTIILLSALVTYVPVAQPTTESGTCNRTAGEGTRCNATITIAADQVTSIDKFEELWNIIVPYTGNITAITGEVQTFSAKFRSNRGLQIKDIGFEGNEELFFRIFGGGAPGTAVLSDFNYTWTFNYRTANPTHIQGIVGDTTNPPGEVSRANGEWHMVDVENVETHRPHDITSGTFVFCDVQLVMTIPTTVTSMTWTSVEFKVQADEFSFVSCPHEFVDARKADELHINTVRTGDNVVSGDYFFTPNTMIGVKVNGELQESFSLVRDDGTFSVALDKPAVLSSEIAVGLFAELSGEIVTKWCCSTTTVVSNASPDDLDSDNDGVADIEDACPALPGVIEKNGC